MQILLFTAGFSSLKFSALGSVDASVIACGTADWSGDETGYQFSAPYADFTETVESHWHTLCGDE
ncbi:MAG: hypothetical protein KDB11_31980 [Planctomycetales bacterium]|nr:hypothetical protein [Planctomycetales bacterium]